jgi:hypothetical protein
MSTPARWPAARWASLRCPQIGQHGPGQELSRAPPIPLLSLPPFLNSTVSSPPQTLVSLERRFPFHPPAARRIPPPLVSPHPIPCAYTTSPSSSLGSDQPPPLPPPAAPFLTQAALRRRYFPPRRRSPSHPACPCRGWAPPLRRAARAHAFPSRFALGPCHPRWPPRRHAPCGPRRGHALAFPVASQGHGWP